jgi:hypothetical protein
MVVSDSVPPICYNLATLSSFIYELLLKSKLPWVYGGEYSGFKNLIIRVVEAWLRLGFRLSFVFDGAPAHWMETADT